MQTNGSHSGAGLGAVLDRAPRAPELSPNSALASGRDSVLSAFADVSAALARGESVDALLNLIAARICELTSIGRCGLYLRDEQSGLFRGSAGYQRGRDITDRVRQLTAGLEADHFTREILATRQPVLITNAMHDQRPVRSVIREWGVQAVLGVPMVLLGEVIGILYLDNDAEPYPFSEETRTISLAFANLAAIAISQARSTSELRHNLVRALRQNEILKRGGALETDLREVTSGGGGLDELTAAVARRAGKPCVIYTADHRRRAAAGQEALTADANPPARDSTRRAEAIQRALDSLYDTAARTALVPPQPEVGFSHRELLAPIWDGRLLWGYIVLEERSTRLGAADQQFLWSAATHASLWLGVEHRVAGAQRRTEAGFARELLEGTVDAAVLRTRAALFGFDPDVDYAVCVCSVDGRPPGVRALKALEAALASELAPALLPAVELEIGSAVILPLAAIEGADCGAEQAAEDLIRRVAARQGVPASLVVAVSRVARGVSGLAGAFAEVAELHACQSRLVGDGSQRVLSAAKFGPAATLLAGVDRAQADRFVQGALGPLVGGERATTELLRTLVVFFDLCHSVGGAATVLGVHENTVRYRLARVHELTGLDIGGSSGDQLTVQVALMILDMTGQLPA